MCSKFFVGDPDLRDPDMGDNWDFWVFEPNSATVGSRKLKPVLNCRADSFEDTL